MGESKKVFTKSKDYLVCIDSDGCAMDTMDIKHFRCFGPCMVTEWHLEEWKDAILNRWNEVNLYTMTRGINRFKGLSLALQEIDEKYCKIEGLAELAEWVEKSPELSNNALKAALGENGNICLEKALAWSQAVNESITKLPQDEILPYPGVKEALMMAHAQGDIAIVSSANPGAVYDEWERHGLLSYTDIVMAQDVGSKSFCIGEMLKKGYAPDHVLMCGDAPGDMAAAQENGVFYYPILVKHEAESWEEFRTTAFEKLLKGEYAGEYQERKIHEFLSNLGQK